MKKQVRCPHGVPKRRTSRVASKCYTCTNEDNLIRNRERYRKKHNVPYSNWRKP